MPISVKPVTRPSSVQHDLAGHAGTSAPPAASWRAELSQLWSLVILPFLLLRLLLIAVGMVAIYYIEPLVSRLQPIHLDAQSTRFPDMLWLMWYHFDSGFYLSIARDGYGGPATLHTMSNWAFFPLYPLLMRALVLPFPLTDTLLRLSGLVIANISALVALIYLYKLTRREFDQRVAARAVFYLALFPMSFYLSAIYPEALFLALTLGSIYHARQRCWWLAGLLGGLAALTRPQGVLLSIVIGWEYWQYLSDQFAPFERTKNMFSDAQNWLRSRVLGLLRSLRSWRTWAGIAALAQIPLGLALFCLYGKLRVDTFFPFQAVERYGWGRTFRNPLKFVIETFTTPVAPSPYDWNFYALGVLVICAFLLLLIPIFRKLPTVYGIFSLLFVLMPLTTGATNSIARYYMEVFPVFMLLAWWSSQGSEEQRLQRHSLLVASFAILLSLGMALFTLGVYSMS